jgi:membrane protein implicated in regulation of membrane protease activity
VKKVSNILHITLELIWLSAALVSVFVAGREAFVSHWRQTLIFAAFGLVSAYFYFSRRNQRLKNNDSK